MCGLFAGIGKLNSNRMTALGSLNQKRGQDSVGIAYLADGQLQVAKIAEPPCVGLNLSLRTDMTRAAVSGMFIGHTRQATQGEVTSANAHPFLIDEIAFAHNGMILNNEKFGKYAVDSESLIHGIKKRDFSEYEGPIALVWIEKGLLTAYRYGNPLFRGQHAGAIYLSSEKDHLEAIGCTKVKELKEGFIYTFHSPTQTTTKKVPMNKLYEYRTTAFDRYDYLTQLYQNGMIECEKEMPKQTESFNTWKDDRKNGKTCKLCADEIAVGVYCADCIEWETEVLGKDLPPVADVLNHQR